MPILRIVTELGMNGENIYCIVEWTSTWNRL